MNKRLAGTGLAIGLVAGAGAGLILELSGSAGAAGTSTAAVGDTTASTAPDATTPDATTPDAPTPADPVRPDPSTRLGEVLKPLVDDGTITQDQADKVIAAIVAARPAGGPDGGGHRGFGGGGPGGPGGLIGKGLDVVATTLGITNDEVIAGLKDGKTLAELATANGKTAQDVIDAIVAEATTRINRPSPTARSPRPRPTRRWPTSPSSPPTSSTTAVRRSVAGSAVLAGSAAPVTTVTTTTAQTMLRPTPLPRPTRSPADVLGSAGMTSSLVIPASQNDNVRMMMYERPSTDRRR